jgi:hypothetical protein
VRQAHRYFRRRKLLRALGLDRGVDDATLAAQAAPNATPEQRAANQAASADARARARAQLRRNQPPPTEHPDDGLMRPSIEGDPDATTPNGDPS